MKKLDSLRLSADEEAFLDAWTIVYIEAKIEQTLGLALSHFLRAPGEYLLQAWLSPPSKVEPCRQSLLKKSAAKQTIH